MRNHHKTIKPEDMLSETLCRCGHELGVHRSTGRECLHGADEMGRNPACSCEKFRAKPVRTEIWL